MVASQKTAEFDFDGEMFFTMIFWWLVGAPVMWRLRAEYVHLALDGSWWGTPVVAMFTVAFLTTVFVANFLYHRLVLKETFFPAWLR